MESNTEKTEPINVKMTVKTGLKFGIILGIILGLITYFSIKSFKKPSKCDCEKITKQFMDGDPNSAEKFLKCMDKYGDDVKKHYREKLIGQEMSGLKNSTYQLQEGDYYLYFSEKCKH
jgi:hypothetical protein